MNAGQLIAVLQKVHPYTDVIVGWERSQPGIGLRAQWTLDAKPLGMDILIVTDDAP